MELFGTKTCAIVNNKADLRKAMSNKLCFHIIWEDGYTVTVYNRVIGDWEKTTYAFFGEKTENDDETTGRIAYQQFYAYAGKDNVERMKIILPHIDAWDSNEQMHYANLFCAGQKIYKPIYEFDANSAFTYGTMQLPKGFDTLKEYMYGLFEQKRDAKTKLTRNKYKNLQNYLVGYFARVKGFVSTRSEIIKGSNNNILDKMSEIKEHKGIVYLSNTDSIITDDYGADVMSKYLGSDVGQFKLVGEYSRLFYNSPNSYQLDDEVTWSGVKRFARDNTDFFSDKIATQDGSLIEGYEFSATTCEENNVKLCRVKYGEVEVTVCNKIGEVVDRKIYKIK